MFELKQQSRNYRHVGNFPTCRQMSCRLDTLADTTFSCVCDVTSDVSRHVARHDTECRHLGTKTTRRHPTYGAKPFTALFSTLKHDFGYSNPALSKSSLIFFSRTHSIISTLSLSTQIPHLHDIMVLSHQQSTTSSPIFYLNY